MCAQTIKYNVQRFGKPCCLEVWLRNRWLRRLICTYAQCTWPTTAMGLVQCSAKLCCCVRWCYFPFACCVRAAVCAVPAGEGGREGEGRGREGEEGGAVFGCAPAATVRRAKGRRGSKAWNCNSSNQPGHPCSHLHASSHPAVQTAREGGDAVYSTPLPALGWRACLAVSRAPACRCSLHALQAAAAAAATAGSVGSFERTDSRHTHRTHSAQTISLQRTVTNRCGSAVARSLRSRLSRARTCTVAPRCPHISSPNADW
jgi:hypothetical protein